MPSFLSPAATVQPGYLVSATDTDGRDFRGTVKAATTVPGSPGLVAWRVGEDTDETLVTASDLVTIHPPL